jgi:glycosyltransferase involved in cell wall biosynthesis
VKTDEGFDILNTFFELFKKDPAVDELRQHFLSAFERVAEMGERVATLRSVYEKAIASVEEEAVRSGYLLDLLKLQRGLYAELESFLSTGDQDARHRFFVVIPVADRPKMLKNCLTSLIEQCRLFNYSGITIDKNGTSRYNKVTLLIIDDSKDRTNIFKIKDMASEMEEAGINTLYVGLDEQTAFLNQLPSELKARLSGLIGEPHNQVLPLKGPSITRNITYLYINELLKGFREKALIYFLDSDEEFRVRVRLSGTISDIPFINYFYWIDRIFESSGIEVMTGKVVGDPPVTPSVMINTFLHDLTLFFETASAFAPTDDCPFHEPHQSGTFSADYHDLRKLFGYEGSSSSGKYRCIKIERHTVKDCFEDFSCKAIGFFYGLHPTRPQLFTYAHDFLKTEKARTVYTGNYVFSKDGLRHFIPYAELGLRMAGPTLGRILKSKIKERFFSANLPLLHRRTLSDTHRDEFRSGVFETGDTIDLSSEFYRQFWGDVLLFSVEALTASGYPVRRPEFQKIVKVVYKTQNDLWNIYKQKKAETEEVLSAMRKYLSDQKYWWNNLPEMKESLKNFLCFFSQAERNFGLKSESCKRLSEQIREGFMINRIVDAIYCYCEDERAWNEALEERAATPLAQRHG